MLLGVMGAMPEEMDKIIAAIGNKEIIERGSRIYYRGDLFGQNVVAVFSRWGKVAAATTVANLILEFNVDRIVFTGVAGAVSPDLHVGDIVIAQRLFQHDMDARPLMRRFEIPLTGKTSYEIPQQNVEIMSRAVHNFLKNDKDFRKILSEQSILHPKLFVGDIASGDLFISSTAMKNALLKNLPSVVLCRNGRCGSCSGMRRLRSSVGSCARYLRFGRRRSACIRHWFCKSTCRGLFTVDSKRIY